MQNRSLKKNAIYNTFKSCVQFIFPVISYSYAARTVGVDNIGRVNYTLSAVSYFTLVAVFGMSTYGVRECAALRDDRESVSKRASELFTFNLLSMIVSGLLLALCVLVIIPWHAYALLFLIQGTSIVFTVIGMDWVNVVFEDYRFITIRGLLINVLNLCILFLFVKSPEDYYVYAFLTVLTPIVVGLSNFFYIRRYVDFKLRVPEGIREHIRKLWPFFLNDMSIAVYVGADMLILGAMKGDHQVGIYSAAVKVYTIVKSVFIAIFSVTVPRLSYHESRSENEEYKGILSRTVSIFMMLALPAMAGLILYADEIVLFLSGADYAEAATPLRLLGVALLFAVFGGVATNCVNVPRGLEKVNGRVALIAALENIILNIPAIYLFGKNGAAFTTLLAELTVLTICLVYYRTHDMHTSSVIDRNDCVDAILGTAAVCAVRFALRFPPLHAVARLFIGIAASGLVYLLILFLRKNRILKQVLGDRCFSTR